MTWAISEAGNPSAAALRTAFTASFSSKPERSALSGTGATCGAAVVGGRHRRRGVPRADSCQHPVAGLCHDGEIGRGEHPAVGAGDDEDRRCPVAAGKLLRSGSARADSLLGGRKSGDRVPASLAPARPMRTPPSNATARAINHDRGAVTATAMRSQNLPSCADEWSVSASCCEHWRRCHLFAANRLAEVHRLEHQVGDDRSVLAVGVVLDGLPGAALVVAHVGTVFRRSRNPDIVGDDDRPFVQPPARQDALQITQVGVLVVVEKKEVDAPESEAVLGGQQVERLPAVTDGAHHAGDPVRDTRVLPDRLALTAFAAASSIEYAWADGAAAAIRSAP